MSDPTIPDWINAGAAVIGATAIIVGLFGANKKLNESRLSARQLRRSEVAEELLALAYNIEDAFRDIRRRFDSIPEEKAGDKLYTFERRYDRIASYSDLFTKIRDAQIRVRAVIGIAEVDDAVDEFFGARNRVASAIEQLADNTRDELVDISREEQDYTRKLRGTLFGSFSEDDELGQIVLLAVRTIENHLNPIARLELNK